MGKEIVLSIIVPIYNTGVILEETIASILSSEFSYPHEIILVNDGSIDKITLNIIEKYRKQFFVIDKENGGLSSARNAGILKAKGKYILPFDSDDLMCGENCNIALKKIVEDPNIGVVYGDYIMFGAVNRYNKSGNYNRLRLIQSGNFVSAIALCKKEIWEKVGGYDEKIVYAEDWHFWSRVAIKNYNFYYLPKPLFKYRIEVNSKSISHTETHRYGEMIESLRKNIPTDIFTSEAISDYVLTSLRESNKLKLKLLLLLFFPRLSKYLLKKGYFPNKIIVE